MKLSSLQAFNFHVLTFLEKSIEFILKLQPIETKSLSPSITIFLPFYHYSTIFCSSPQAFSSNVSDAERQHGRHPGLPCQQALRRVSLDNSVRCNLQVIQIFLLSFYFADQTFTKSIFNIGLLLMWFYFVFLVK